MMRKQSEVKMENMGNCNQAEAKSIRSLLGLVIPMFKNAWVEFAASRNGQKFICSQIVFKSLGFRVVARIGSRRLLDELVYI